MCIICTVKRHSPTTLLSLKNKNKILYVHHHHYHQHQIHSPQFVLLILFYTFLNHLNYNWFVGHNPGTVSLLLTKYISLVEYPISIFVYGNSQQQKLKEMNIVGHTLLFLTSLHLHEISIEKWKSLNKKRE